VLPAPKNLKKAFSARETLDLQNKDVAVRFRPVIVACRDEGLGIRIGLKR
jgi:hypothetical protein